MAPPGRYGHAAVYDPVRDRLIVFGGSTGGPVVHFNEVWTMALSGPPNWTKLAIAGTLPPGRSETSAIYDPVRERIIVFGGRTGSSTAVNDVWALSLSGGPAWTQLAPSGTPPSARSGHAAIYDPVRDRMLVFGGFGSTPGEVWALPLSSPAWTQLAPSGGPPVARTGACAIYDPVRDALVVFGGASPISPSTTYNDTWALSLATESWLQIANVGPLPSVRNLASAIYDPVHDEMVVFGGQVGNASSPNLNDVWSLPLANPVSWNAMSPSGTAPRWRHSHAAVYDAPRGRMIVFGGNHGLTIFANDVWSLSLGGSPAWTELSPDRPGPKMLRDHTAIYDSFRDRMVIFGGWYYDGSTVYADRTWLLSLSSSPAWTGAFPFPAPLGRNGHTAIYDPLRNRMIVFGGGRAGSSTTMMDVWELSLADPMGWNQLAPTGTFPTNVYQSSAIYDPVRDRMIVFGGGGTLVPSNAVVALSLAGTPAWSTLATTGGPPTARWSQSAVYDPVRDRMVVFGGRTSSSVYLNDVWALSLSTLNWSLITTAGGPPNGRAEHVAVYDAVRDRMVVSNGNDVIAATGTFRYQGDTWALSFASNQWTLLHPTGVLPDYTEQSAIYDPLRDRMVVFGGDDVFAANATGDLRELRWSVPAAAEPRAPRGLRLSVPRPNPARGGTTATLELPSAAQVDARVFDVEGRAVRTLMSGALEPGNRELRWDGATTTGERVLPGVYFLGVRIGEQWLRRAVVIVR